MKQMNVTLERKYFYVQSKEPFELKGTNQVNFKFQAGFFCFLVSNVSETLGSSTVVVEYSDNDTDFSALTSDLYVNRI